MVCGLLNESQSTRVDVGGGCMMRFRKRSESHSVVLLWYLILLHSRTSVQCCADNCEVDYGKLDRIL